MRFTPSIRESYSALYLLRLGRFGKELYARVLLHLLKIGIETVPAKSERKSEVKAWMGDGVVVLVCECERRAATQFGESIQVVGRTRSALNLGLKL